MASPKPDPSRCLRVICLTGGPGGGKSTLQQRMAIDEEWAEVTVVMEEAIRAMRFVRLHPRTPEFQCALVATQAATEESLQRALAGSGKWFDGLTTLSDVEGRLLVTHRGTLDPCAFWQSFGHSKESFFEMTGTR